MADIRLTPGGKPILELHEGDDAADMRVLAGAFGQDWREGLFLLAAKPAPSPTLRFWGGIAAHFLTQLCHIPAGQSDIAVETPGGSQLAAWIEAVPPMLGGEYLSPDLLTAIWADLARWVQETVALDGGIDPFLRKRAPRWNQVGRVTFHLAENRNNPLKPFAFMASFSTGVGSGGEVKHLPLGKALERYAGTKNRPALIRLLTPVEAAAGRCDWVRELVDSKDIYRPRAWTAAQAFRMLRSSLLLEESGLSVRLPDWWKKRPRPLVTAVIGNTGQTRLGAEAMLDFQVHVALGDSALSREELAELLSGKDGLVLFKGRWIEVDRERLQQALDHWRALERQSRDGRVSFIQGMRLLAGASADLKDVAEDETERSWAHVQAGEAMRKILAHLRDPGRLNGPDWSTGLRADLRPYQRHGADWLHLLTKLGLGACLADDMGLGKTMQVLALLSQDAAQGPGAPSLLILPASLLGNWRSEIERFAPGLKLLVAHPSEMHKTDLDALARDPAACLSGYDLVATTYALAARSEWLAVQPWRLVILDEAQAIKNHATHQSKAVKRIPAQARIALTGTPVENRLGDLWSLFDFLNPGLLGTVTQFKRFIKVLEAREHNPFGPLRKLISPYILRRLKTDKTIIADLPDKTETVRYCFLSREQVAYYQHTVRAMEKALGDKNGLADIARRGLVLQTMMRLKQICNHPGQFLGDGDYAPHKSGKFLQLAEICRELAERQEKVLIFSQFREIIPALEEHLAEVFGRPGLHLHGGTDVKQRKRIVAQFQQDDGPPFFILSLKAGGTGLNLTAASHVIHFDRWWNPAVENQATDRSFRIGQKKNVLVHKFVTTGTIEEKIDKLIAEKQVLAEELLSGSGELRLTELPNEELLDLVRLDITRAAMA